MCRKLLFILLALTVPALGAGGDATWKALERELKNEYTGKTVTLNGFYRGAQLEYAQDGSVKGGSKGLWEIDGVILIKKIGLRNRQLKIEAVRMVAFPDEANQKVLFEPFGGKVEVLFGTSVGTDTTKLRECVANSLVPDDVVRTVLIPDLLNWSRPETSKVVRHANAKGAPEVFRKDWEPIIASGVSAPKPIRKSDPSYTRAAQAAKIQGNCRLGIIISVDGSVQEIKVFEPLPLGLTQMAIATVRDWRFVPAMRSGEPVATVANIEVQFRLY